MAVESDVLREMRSHLSDLVKSSARVDATLTAMSERYEAQQQHCRHTTTELFDRLGTLEHAKTRANGQSSSNRRVWAFVDNHARSLILLIVLLLAGLRGLELVAPHLLNAPAAAPAPAPPDSK